MLYKALIFLVLFSVAPLRAALIDPFDSTSGWSSFADTNSTASISSVAGLSGNALQVDYDLTSGSFAGITRTFNGQNLSGIGANALRFSYRATGSTNTAEVKLVDGDGPSTVTSDNLVFKFIPVTDNVWRTFTVPLSGMITFPNGDGDFNFGNVTKFSFGMTKENGTAGPGVTFFDDFKLVTVSQPSALIDSAEFGPAGCGATNSCVNERPGPQAIIYFQGGGGAGSSGIVSVGNFAGARARQLSCNAGAGFCGVTEVLGGMPLRGDESLRFLVMGAAGGEPLRLELKSAGQTAAVNVSGIPILNPVLVTVPISSFTANNPLVNLNALTELVFLFNTAGNHQVTFDQVQFVGPTATPRDVAALEDFNTDLAQLSYNVAAPTATATVALTFERDPSAPGSVGGGQVGRLAYSFAVTPSTPFAVAERSLAPDFTAESQLRFRFRGTGGNNDLEVKLEDADGTVYVKRFSDVTNTGNQWKTVTIPIEQFSFSAVGTDSILDLRNVNKIDFAMSRGQDAPAVIAFDTLETARAVALEKGAIGRVVSRVSTPSNPFSPNGDGVRDSFQLSFDLTQTARVVLRIYNLQGVPIKKFDAGDRAAGTHTFDWDGVGDDGRRAPNGIYMFVLEADGAIDGKDTYKQVVGVVR